jgi:hypothetical protein
VYLLGSSKLSLSKIAQAGSFIRIWAHPGETPVLDCTGNTSDGISISGSYYHLKGIEQKNAGHNGINISGNNNIIESCTVHDNQNTGLHLVGSGVGPSNNLILNCDAYRNYDPPISGNADGFSAKWTVGSGNVFRGCNAYNNSNDGWDLWMETGSVLIDSCFAFWNGVDRWHSGSFDGNGNGFKLGGEHVTAPHIVRNVSPSTTLVIQEGGLMRTTTPAGRHSTTAQRIAKGGQLSFQKYCRRCTDTRHQELQFARGSGLDVERCSGQEHLAGIHRVKRRFPEHRHRSGYSAKKPGWEPESECVPAPCADESDD